MPSTHPPTANGTSVRPRSLHRDSFRGSLQLCLLVASPLLSPNTPSELFLMFSVGTRGDKPRPDALDRQRLNDAAPVFSPLEAAHGSQLPASADWRLRARGGRRLSPISP